MDYKQELIKMIDAFNIQSVEEFKEAEFKIINDSKFRSIFKKVDYDANIRMLRTVKKHAQKLDPKAVKVPADDVNTSGLKDSFQRCLVVFSGVCDSYVQLQMALKKKSDGEELSFREYKEIHNKVKYARASMNERMHDLDVRYSDYAGMKEADEDIEDLGDVSYMTYDSIK